MANSLHLFRMIAIVLALSVSGMVGSANASQFRILNGNAIEVDGETLVLYGIAVPISTAKCLANNEKWTCGAAATLRLHQLLNTNDVKCESVDKQDSVAFVICKNAEFNIAQQLVLEGWALTVPATEQYSMEENSAKNQMAGVWRGGFNPPDEWRVYPNLEFDPFSDLLCSTCADRKQRRSP